MRKVFGITITDEMEEAMLDAIDLYGVYAYYSYKKVPDVIFVVMLERKSVGPCHADTYLRKRLPELCWVVIANEWLNWDDMDAVPLFLNGGWLDDYTPDYSTD